VRRVEKTSRVGSSIVYRVAEAVRFGLGVGTEWQPGASTPFCYWAFSESINIADVLNRV